VSGGAFKRPRGADCPALFTALIILSQTARKNNHIFWDNAEMCFFAKIFLAIHAKNC